jgi:phosphomannomutase
VAGTRGEFIFSRFLPAYDGMFASVRLLEALARAGAPLSELAAALPPIHVTQTRIACPWGRRGGVMRRLMDATEGDQRDLVDGVKVWKADSDWVLIIPHSHRPYFVVTVEGSNPDVAESLLGQYGRLVEKWRDEP